VPPVQPAEDIARSVFRAIEAHNASEGSAIPAREDTVLLGEGGAVDSLGLVRLIMTVERQIEDDLGVQLSLTDEKAMSQRNSPFRSVGSLTAYIATCLERP
jgi:acyl carrier protein